MGISRDIRHKRRATGGRRNFGKKKKRKFELGRQPAMTKLANEKRIHMVRCRGGRMKRRALRLDTGNFSFSSQGVTTKARILDVVYNASNNELVRTKTLVKNCIVQVDATPFRQFIKEKYDVNLTKKEEEEAVTKRSRHCQRKKEKAREGLELEDQVKQQIKNGRLLACISSRPGQCGRADGYILEGSELDFYRKKMSKKH